MSRTEKIQRLIEWCERRGEMGRLRRVLTRAPIIAPPATEGEFEELLTRLIGYHAILEYLIAYAETEGGVQNLPPRMQRDINRYLNLMHNLKLRLLL